MLSGLERISLEDAHTGDTQLLTDTLDAHPGWRPKWITRAI